MVWWLISTSGTQESNWLSIPPDSSWKRPPGRCRKWTDQHNIALGDLWRLNLRSFVGDATVRLGWHDNDNDDDDDAVVKHAYLLVNHLDSKGNYSATSNNTKLAHWPLMDGLLHLVQRGGAWAACGPVQSPPRCTKYNSPPINAQCTNHCIVI